MNRPVAVSTDGNLFAVGSENVLKIKYLKNNYSRHPCTYQSQGSIQLIKISPNNAHAAWITKQPIQVCIQSLLTQDTLTTIDNDKAKIGFQTIIWSPDSQFLLVVSKHSVYINVFNVNSKTTFKISGAILGRNKTNVCSFNADGSYFACVERSNPAIISIYSADDFNKVKELKVRGITDTGGMVWCQDSLSMLVWQSVSHYQLSHCTVDGRVEHETKKDWVVVYNVLTSPNCRWIAVSSDDLKITIMDLLTWKEVEVLEHEQIILNSDDITIYKEASEQEQETSAFIQTSCDVIQDKLVSLSRSKAPPKFKKSKMSFSRCGSFLVSYEPLLGEVVWIWDLTKRGKLSTLIILDENTSTIKKVMWHPNQPRLIVDLAEQKILVWDVEKCVVIRAREKTIVFNGDLYLATSRIAQEESENDSDVQE